VEGYLDGFTAGLLRDAAAAGETLSPPTARARSIALLIELVGAMTMARAVQTADPGLSAEILQVAREQVHSALTSR
jgi:TetR/AcrR family transcriptional repressor of nem operon